MSIKEIENLIKKYNLKPALQRDVSFLGHSIYGKVYVRDMMSFVGFGYGAIGGMWINGLYQSMSNDRLVAKNVKSFLEKGNKNFKSARRRAIGKYRNGRRQFEIVQKKFSEFPIDTIKDMLKIYSDYFPALGFYNAIMRFVGDKSFEEVGLNKKELEKIGKERNESATLYNDIEQFFKKSFPVIGNILNIDGDLIRFMSYAEVLEILNGAVIYKNLLNEANNRRKHYFYLFTEDGGSSEYIVLDKKSIDQIYNKYFITASDNEVKGQIAFPGIIKGRVRILFSSVSERELKINNGDILVAVHTHPRYIELIKKSSAVVTDEGGTLSHAAIIARELKIPCIIGTKIATKVLKDGDLVEVNANNGVVKILKRYKR